MIKYCMDCAFFNNGQCYRYPPQIFQETSQASGYYSYNYVFRYPLVDGYSSACGEWKRREGRGGWN